MGEAVDVRVLDRLQESVGGDAGIVRSVIERYLLELDGRLDALRAASTDSGQLVRAAHALASPSATLGVRGVADPCLELERLGERGGGDADEVARLTACVEDAARQAMAQLRAWSAGRAA
jgi:HPt (histidine-containing phosphotransfer) domain-containing protein